MTTPEITLWQVSPCTLHSLHDGVGGLDALSVGMPQPRLKNVPGACQVRFPRGSVRRFGQIEVVTGQSDHQLGKIVQAQALDSLSRAQVTGGIQSKNLFRRVHSRV